jgi:hypothetical protein
MARRSKKTEEQMKLFEEGGLKDEGGTVDPVSGNDVPVGSTQKEVRDDIPAQLSEGEFVFPADVTRYIGLENLMELRNKAKKGLAQMEAMGQMGNSEEATMDDTEEMDVDIDSLIDEFDPNSPESMQFAIGGVVKAQAGALIPSGQMPPQQFSYGYMPPTPPQQPIQYPQYGQMIQQPAQGAVSGAPAVEDRQYIGPNGELITIRFMNGKPQQNIPQGFRVYKPEEEQAEVVAPTVTPENNEDASDDRAREAEREAQMAKDKDINTTLATLDADFAKLTAKDPFMTGKPTANIAGGIYAGVQTHLGRTKAIENIADKYNIDLDQYKNTGLEGVLSTYDDERFAKDIKGIIEDPKREEKARAQRSLGSEEDYERDFGMSADEAKAQRKEDLDEIADAVDRGEIGGSSDDSGRNERDSFSGMSDEDKETQTQEDQDEMEDGGFLYRGGLAKQTQRALKSSRKK